MPQKAQSRSRALTRLWAESPQFYPGHSSPPAMGPCSRGASKGGRSTPGSRRRRCRSSPGATEHFEPCGTCRKEIYLKPKKSEPCVIAMMNCHLFLQSNHKTPCPACKSGFSRPRIPESSYTQPNSGDLTGFVRHGSSPSRLAFWSHAYLERSPKRAQTVPFHSHLMF